ncbi:MAG: DEAD/DEAH box helicase [Clostridiales bacterium]|nr:DEAD/DEAH box helicase [Clostridiales bacterium]
MLPISQDMIRGLVTDEATFYRGVHYYKKNAVSHVTWSKNSRTYYGIVHGGNDYQVSIQELTDGQVKYACNCPFHIKNEGACKHVVAMMLFLEHYLSHNQNGETAQSAEEKKVQQILDYFGQEYVKKPEAEEFALEVTIRIPEILSGTSGRCYVSLQAGGERFYKVSNIKKFLADLYAGNDFSLGKQFKYVAGENSFCESARRILSYLMEIYEIESTLGKVYYNNLYSKAEMVLSADMLKRLLHQIGSEPFHLILGEHDLGEIHFAKENPPIVFRLEKEDQNFLLSQENNTVMQSVSKKGDLILCGDTLYETTANFARDYLPFYQSLGQNREVLQFAQEQKDRFVELVLPRIQESVAIHVPDDMKDCYIKEPLHKKVYLDAEGMHVTARIEFVYGNFAIDSIKGELPAGYIIARDRDEEQEFLSFFRQFHFRIIKNHYRMEKEEDIYQLLSEGLPKLLHCADVYISDTLASMKPRKLTAGKVHMNYQESSHLLELSYDYPEVSKEELHDLMTSLILKKRYHRLKDGTFLLLPESEESPDQILSKLPKGSHRLSKDGNLMVAGQFAPYLSMLINHKDMLSIQEMDTRIRIPSTVHATLRSYQRTGIRWLCHLASRHFAGILADDMGLGKTLQAIAYMAVQLSKEPDARFLVVSPTSLVYNWVEEFEKFFPSASVCVVEGTPKEREQFITKQNASVFLTSYPLIRRDIDNYTKLRFHTVFLDEAQFIKNPDSQNAKAVKKLVSANRFAMTGTPIENSLMELWSIFDFLMPGYLYSHKEFMKHYLKGVSSPDGKEMLKELGNKINPFILRRMKQDVLKELPEKTELTMTAYMTPEQEKIYRAFLEESRNRLMQSIKENGVKKMRFEILSVLTRLRQICCHPSTFLEHYNGGSGKLDLLLSTLSQFTEDGRRILLFSQFTSMLDLIAKELDRAKEGYFYLSGSTSKEDRSDMVNRFNNGENSIFLISLKAGGTGLNLTGADTVIHYDPWWNPAVEEQATDRAYRIGQKHSVEVVKLITRNSIEEKILKLQKKKQLLSDSVIRSQEIFLNQLTIEELEEVFS